MNTGANADTVREQFVSRHAVLVRDLLEPKAWIYWTDLIVSVVVGYTALVVFVWSSVPSLSNGVAFIVAAFALYRALMFIHELAHLPSGRFQMFRAAWNILVGIPLMTPSFLYAEHRTHHMNHSYGTRGDAEYVPIGRGSVWGLVIFVLQGIAMPVLAIVRFGIIAPLSCLHPSLRRFIWQRASGLTQNNLDFRRPDPTKSQRLVWGLQEFGCFAVCVALFWLTRTGLIGAGILLRLYVLFAFITTMSYLRALCSHMYASDGKELSYLEQMFDSTTIEGASLLTELWAPVGQRYHALHHLYPSIPYHSLGTAHRRLMDELPQDSPYHTTLRTGLLDALIKLYRQSVRLSRHAPSSAGV